MSFTSQPSIHRSAKAYLSLAFGIGGLLFCLVAPIAVYLGNKAVKEIEASQGRLLGIEAAKYGIVLGWIGSVLLAFFSWIAAIYLKGLITGEYP